MTTQTEHYERTKSGVEIRRTLTSCNDADLANFMQQLTQLLIQSDQKKIVYEFIVNISRTQTPQLLQKIHQILPTQCKINDSIKLSQDFHALSSTMQGEMRSKRHRNRRKKKKRRNIISGISTDVHRAIFTYLNFEDLISLELTCRYFFAECAHPNALHQITYSFDNEHLCGNDAHKKYVNFNTLRFANIHKLSLVHEYGEFDQNVTLKQFNPKWLQNVNELSCLFATEYLVHSEFVLFLMFGGCKFQNIEKLSINLGGQIGTNWLDLILSHVVNAECVKHLYLTHILESTDVMNSILNCTNLRVLSINLDFPTFKFYDATEYNEYFERKRICLPNIEKIIYFDGESAVGVNEWLHFIGSLIENSKRSHIDLSLSYRYHFNRKGKDGLFDKTLNGENVIKKLQNLSIDVDDAMNDCVNNLADKLLKFDHVLNSLSISGVVIRKALDFEMLFEKYRTLFERCNHVHVQFVDYYAYDSVRVSMVNQKFLAWVQRLVQIAPNKVFIDFKSRI